MSHRSSDLLAKVCCGGLLMALLGCGRSAVVVAPEGTSLADEPVVARGKADEPADTSFTFPEDAGGELLAKVLPPKEPQVPRPNRVEPRGVTSASQRMKPPSLPLPPSHASLPRLPASAPSAPLHPRLILDETLGGIPDALVLPQIPSFPDFGRIRVPSPDVHEPLALPIVGQPVSDRASLDDPTDDASTAAALSAPIPARTTKAPFLKLTLPDPYDHRRTGVPALEESKEFPLGSPRTPRR